MEGILDRLNSQLEPSTKEEVVRGMCLLAGNNTQSVVPLLLSKSLPWDRYLSQGLGIHSPAQQTLPSLTRAPHKNDFSSGMLSL